MLKKRLGGFILERGGFERFLYGGYRHSNSMKCLIDFDNINAFFFSLKPALGNKAFIEQSGDYFNNKKENTKSYKQLWHHHLWDYAVEESSILERPEWRADYLRSFLKSFTVYHFHDTSISSAMRRDCQIGDNEFLRHDASNLAAFLFRLQLNEPQSLKMIEKVVSSVAPYFKSFKLRENPNKPGFITLEWEEVDSDAYMDAYSFSDGTLRFIALATLLLQPIIPDTIIIDEPELGLHPAAINKLAAMIKRVAINKQVIIATQSTNLVNNFDPENIVIVDRLHKQTVFKRLDKSELNTWLEDYSLGEMWEKNIIGGQP